MPSAAVAQIVHATARSVTLRTATTELVVPSDLLPGAAVGGQVRLHYDPPAAATSEPSDRKKALNELIAPLR